MKAVVLSEHGGPEALLFREIEDPSPRRGEVLIRVRACGVNNLDTQIRRGIPGISIEMPHILGCDIAGEVLALGDGASDAGPHGLVLGAKAIVCPGAGCGRCPACLAGAESYCPRYSMLGYQRHGGYAELVRVPAGSVIPVMGEWSFEEWASAPLVFLTAWHMLLTRARLGPAETVLVHAAGSGVGIAATQIAKRVGARVIVTAGSDAKLRRALELGADLGIDYTKAGWHKDVKRITGGEGVDVVVEHTGATTWPGSMACLARGGRLVTCGATSGYEVGIDLRHLFVKQVSLLGSYMGAQRELLSAVALLERGELRPVVDAVFPLGEAKAAHEKVASRELFGKIVLAP